MANIVKVDFFGTFEMTYSEKSITSDDIKSDKLLKLLAFCITNSDRLIPSSELIDLIWYYEDVDNPIGALKNLVYRLRTVLKKELGLKDLIVTGKSAYSISSSYKIISDQDEFEKLNKALEENPKDEETFERLLGLYKGKFLSEIEDDHRVMARSALYHSIYVNRSCEYCHLLEEQKKYDKMEEVARKALEIDKLEESVNIALIRSLYLQKRYRQATDTYKQTTDMLYRYLGTNPSDEMKDLYELIQKENHDASADIFEIQGELADDEKNGALLCEYGAFRDLYSMQARMMDRLGVCAHLCLLTVNDYSSYETDREKNKQYVEKTMQKICDSLVAGLRIGDVVSRFSVNQFVVLLPTCNYEDSQMVMNRVLKKIKHALNNKNIAIDLSVQEVTSAE